MQTKKVRDILPPSRAKAKEPREATILAAPAQRPLERSSKKTLALLFFVLCVGGIAGALSLQFFFAKAKVSVWPRTNEVSVQEHVTVRASAEGADDAQKALPAVILSEERSLTRLFPATGTSTEQGRSRGIIRVYNGFSTFPQKLISQTRFLSEDRKLFRSLDAVVIPAGHMEGNKLVAGFLDIEVVAAESGEEYNISVFFSSRAFWESFIYDHNWQIV